MESLRRARVVRILLCPIDRSLTEEIRRRAQCLKRCELACSRCLRRFQEFRRRDWLRFGCFAFAGRAAQRRRWFRAPIVIAITVHLTYGTRAPDAGGNEGSQAWKF